MDKLFVGIDVSSQFNTAYLMRPNGEKYNSFRFNNNPGSVKKLSSEIVSALDNLKISNVEIGIEATSIYGEPLLYSLREDGKLGQFSTTIHVLNPKQVRKFRESYSELPKNDYIDAFVIADNLRFGRSNLSVFMDDYRYRALQMLTRERFFTVNKLVREKQHFANYLFLKCSGLALDDGIKNTSATMIALMEHYDSVDELASADLFDLTKFVSKAGRGRFPDPEKIAKIVKSAASGSYRLPKTVNDSVNQAMSISIASIRTLESLIKKLDKDIATQLKAIPNTLIFIPGIGPVYSAGIIAEIGDIRRFASHAQLAKFAGLTWTQHQSGSYESDRKRLIKTGNRFLRYCLREAANSMRKTDCELRRYYERKYNEVKHSQHKRALILTTRKFVRLIFRLLKDNRVYIAPER